jgi:hypothetical protein
MKDGKNLHLEHLEDEIINKGSEGGKQAIKILREMGKFLSGVGGNVKVTTKWDGAPAIVCGTDPADGKFFVGTKSVFAKTEPKICKSEADVQRIYDGTLAKKLAQSYRLLKDCSIKGVLQGDLMFTDDKKTETIDGERLIAFRPNTITYAVDPDSELGRKISRAQLGIVFHTKYEGATLPVMTSSFDVKDTDYKSNSSVWIEKAEFKDIGGVASMTMTERNTYDAAVNKAEGSLKQSSRVLDMIQTGKKNLQLDTEFKKFFNKYVKSGNNIPSVETAYTDFLDHLKQEFGKAIDKVKTDAAKNKKAVDLMEKLKKIEDNKQGFKMLIASYMNLQVAKNILVNKMKQVQSLRLFVDMGNGDYKVTSPEGFVGISGRTAVKFIDRLEFARLNFTVPKSW